MEAAATERKATKPERVGREEDSGLAGWTADLEEVLEAEEHTEVAVSKEAAAGTCRCVGKGKRYARIRFVPNV